MGTLSSNNVGFGGVMVGSPDKRGKKQGLGALAKGNFNSLRFNVGGTHHQLYSDQIQLIGQGGAVLHHENWDAEGPMMVGRGGHSQGAGHFKIGNKMKLGAATSTNFMKAYGQNSGSTGPAGGPGLGQHVSMLRSVQ